MQEYHIPIMLDETVGALEVKPERLYFDGTLGGGGHSERILKLGGRIIATDRDGEAIDYALGRFSKNSDYNGRYTLVKDNFKNVLQILKERHITELNGAILDLGISSHQIDEANRGFSYMSNAQLDMRMDRDQFLSAMTVVNDYGEDELSRIIFTYGEERAARKIAAKIVERRKKEPIETTSQLTEIIRSCVPDNPKAGHPAKRTFQALRIEVNSELKGLGEALSDIVSVLKSGARLAVITFHSLEDRIVKQTFRYMSTDCVCDKSLPICVCGHKATVKQISHKGIKPTEKEISANSRSKSATLRIVEKL